MESWNTMSDTYQDPLEYPKESNSAGEGFQTPNTPLFPSSVVQTSGLPVDKPYFKIEKNSKGYNWELKGLAGEVMPMADIDKILEQKDYIENKLAGII
jgi:hypothetical protein